MFETKQIILTILIIVGILLLVVGIIFSIIEDLEYRKTCEKEFVCYYMTGGGVFSLQSKIYFDCNNTNFIPSSNKIIKEWACK